MIAVKLEGLDVDIRALNFQLIDLLDEESEDMEREQDTLDKHDDDIAALSVQVKQLISKSSGCATPPDGGKEGFSTEAVSLGAQPQDCR